MTETSSNREVLSVSQLSRSARQLLEGEFFNIFVEGEISNLVRPASGHWYLTLKDDKAQIRCAMFANRNRLVRFTPKNGTQVVIRGKVSLYEARGDFQLIAEFMEEAGDGALRRAFDKLKAQLDSEGLFSADAKQPVPPMPAHIAVITSPSGAAIRDVLHVLDRRFPAIPVSVIPVQVQGDQSPAQIVEALAFANRCTKPAFDVILLTRGGGSLEDLWSFNTEPVARAIHASRIPVVAAVGHEIDFSIADFVADMRAPTPSAAAEMLSPDQADWQSSLDRTEQRLAQRMQELLRRDTSQLSHLSRRLRHPGQRLTDLHQRLDDLELRLQRALHHGLERRRARLALARSKLKSPRAGISNADSRLNDQLRRLQAAAKETLSNREQRLETARSRLHAYSHESTLARGYAIIKRDDQIIRRHDEVNSGDTVTAWLQDGELTAEVTDTRADHD